MRYRKFRGDLLFTGHDMFGNDKVLVTDEAGKIDSILDVDDAGEGILSCEGIISPGFVNCHCHLELSHLKGKIPTRSTLPEFAHLVMSTRDIDAEGLAERMENEINNMLANGIMGVGDICNTDISLPVKAGCKILFQNFVEISGWVPGMASQRFEAAYAVYNKFRQAGQTASLVPHAAYSVASPLWEKMSPFFRDSIVSIHNQESQEENELFKKGEGKFLELYSKLGISNINFKPPGISSLQAYFSKLKDAASVVLVHNTFTDESDIDYLIDHSRPDRQLSLCICPRANKYIEDTLPPIDLFYKKGMHIVTGTDSLASSESLNILDELKLIVDNFPSIPFSQMLKWATLNGAVALKLEDKLGSFTNGNTPGVVNITEIHNSKLTPGSKVVRLA
ncbi:amidohydrolase family protein [soil metagenome]